MRGLRFVLALTLLVAAPATGCGRSNGSPALTGSGPIAAELVGSWTSTVTREDFTTKGITDVHAQNENSGIFVWTFTDTGTWSSVQTSLDGAPIVNPVFRGTWTAVPGALTITTAFPAEYADNGVRFTWQIEDGKLSLHVLDPPDPLMPIIVETHPWVRPGG